MNKSARRIILIAHNIRSAHNVGSLMRTADGLGIEKVILTGYTPYPELPEDKRPPHIRRKVTDSLSKTALGAEGFVDWSYTPAIADILAGLEKEGFIVAALEQTGESIALDDFRPGPRIALVAGNEVSGLEEDLLANIKYHLQIPMLGSKESFNVSVAAAMALYHLRYLDKHSS